MKNLETEYATYLLSFLERDFEDMIDCEILSYEEWSASKKVIGVDVSNTKDVTVENTYRSENGKIELIHSRIKEEDGE